MAQSLINANFSRTYNPVQGQNAVSNIKRLLTSRDTLSQNRACGYLIEVISGHPETSLERNKIIQYLLDNDIVVFLCEAISNLDWSLFRNVLNCIRSIWRAKRFFEEEHGAIAAAAVLRTLSHYAASGMHVAVDTCLHFLCDLFTGIRANHITSPISQGSPYSVEQLFACLDGLKTRVGGKRGTILGIGLVFHSLVSHQPPSLVVRASTGGTIAKAAEDWYPIMMDAMNHATLTGDESCSADMFFTVICQLGIDLLRLSKLLKENKPRNDFVQTILADEQENASLQQISAEMIKTLHKTILELVTFTKENYKLLPTEEYVVFLRFLYNFLSENSDSEMMLDFCEVLFVNGYLSLLPQIHMDRNEKTISKISTLVLGEFLVHLSRKYLNFHVEFSSEQNYYVTDIQMGLVDLQSAIERPQAIGPRLQRPKPYSLLIYLYFYCQSSESPPEATAHLLPHLIKHILSLPTKFEPPRHIVKCLWLVFAMATVSNTSLSSLQDRVYVERATNKLMDLLQPDPAVYYTHNPAILLWTFTSQRIVNSFGSHVLCRWLEFEETMPIDLITNSIVRQLLLNVLMISKDKRVLSNAVKVLETSLHESNNEEKQNFANSLWCLLPNTLSKYLINYDHNTEINNRYLLELATELIPIDVDQTVCLKTAVLISTIFSKTPMDNTSDDRWHYEYVCLKLSLYLLELTQAQNDYRVLMAYSQRVGYLPRVLETSRSANPRVACAALQLLSRLVHCCNKAHYQPATIIEMDTTFILRSLSSNSSTQLGAALTQLVYMLLVTPTSPVVLADITDGQEETAYVALRALMFRLQMLCCKESTEQSSAGWKTMSAIFRYAIITKNDNNLVTMLTMQPWTHTLIRYQLSQKVSKEFLDFVLNWLNLSKITKDKSDFSGKKVFYHKHSLMYKTLVLLKKKLLASSETDVINKFNILVCVKQLLGESMMLSQQMHYGVKNKQNLIKHTQ